MVEVWLGVALSALLAAALVVAGARRRPSRADDGEVGALLADRRDEIATEARVQKLPQDQVAALEEELALEFIDSGEQPSVADAAAAAKPPLLSLLAGVAVAAVAAVALYGVWGEPHGPTLAEANRLMADDGATPEALADLERAIAGRVARNPGDADGWFYLGHLRMRTGDYQSAAQAFAALHELTGGGEPVDLTWAQAGFLAAGGIIDDATRKIVDRVLVRQPEHPNMLELLAMDAIRRTSLPSAAGFLERALRQTLPDRRRALLEETLALVRARLDDARPLIEVTVDVAGAPLPWLTVFARPVGARMPVAVVRRPARATQTLILDDTVGMDPASPLSVGGAVEVVARLSSTGTVGDSAVEAVSEPVVAATQPRVLLTLDARQASDASDADGVAVVVSSDVALDAAVPVFVIARRPESPGPPVAVRRVSAGELPLRMTLTDADAMMPGDGKLTDLDAVEVLARASLSGAPTASSGDLQSVASTTRPGAAPVELRIGQVVP